MYSTKQIVFNWLKLNILRKAYICKDSDDSNNRILAVFAKNTS